jgi:hypothetical protein
MSSRFGSQVGTLLPSEALQTLLSEALVGMDLATDV